MKKRSESPRKDIDINKLDQFASKARGGGTNVESAPQKKKKEPKTLDRFYTAIDPSIKEVIQAVAWEKRISQREVVEKAIRSTFPPADPAVKESVSKYRTENP